MPSSTRNGQMWASVPTIIFAYYLINSKKHPIQKASGTKFLRLFTVNGKIVE